VRTTTWIDLGVGALTAGAVFFAQGEPPVIAALAVVAGVSGVLWRRPGWCAGIVMAAEVAALALGQSPPDEAVAAMVLLAAISLGAFVSLATMLVAVVGLSAPIVVGAESAVDLRWPLVPLCLGAFGSRACAGAFHRARAEQGRVPGLAAMTEEEAAHRVVVAERA
jgi:hypothetical protein